MTQRALNPNDLFRLKFLQAAELSPDDRWICTAISTVDETSDAEQHHLWLYPASGGDPRQLTYSGRTNGSPIWSPDRGEIAFLSDRGTDGKSQIYLLSVDGGEARALTHLPQGVAGPLAWSPAGEWIAFSANSQAQAERDPTDPYRVTRQVYRFDAMGYLDQQVQDLYVVSVSSGEVKQLTADSYHNGNPRWSPDGARILYSAQMAPDTPCAYFARLSVVDLAGNITVVVDTDWGDPTGSANWLPDGEQIAFIASPKGAPIGTKEDLYVTDASGQSTPVCRSSKAALGVGGRLQADMPSGFMRQPPRILVSQDGAQAYGRIQVGGALRLARVALVGPEAIEIISEEDRSYAPFALSSDGNQLVCAASDMHAPLELLTVDLAERQETQLSTLNNALLAEIATPAVEHLLFPSKDGVQVEGWLVHPNTGQAPYPTILYIHGGPHSGFGHIYHFDTQMLVGAGYAVLLVNHRASTGYGDAFSTAIKGDWGNLDYADLMAGVDAAIDAGLTDPDRLGVCGLSGGGNLSCWIVGQTDRFKAAVPENPLTNWQSFYGVSDIGVWFSLEQLGGHPHEIPEVYSRCSPITYAHRCTTPTLLVQCENDWRCPAEQSEQFYNVLKANGCTVEMLRIPGGSHGSCIVGPPKVRRAQNEALLAWMQRFV